MDDDLITLSPDICIGFSKTKQRVYLKIKERYLSKGYFIFQLTFEQWKFLLTPDVSEYVLNEINGTAKKKEFYDANSEAAPYHDNQDTLGGYKFHFDASDYGSLGIIIPDLGLTLEIWVKGTIINLYVRDNKMSVSIDEWKDIMKLHSKIINHLLGKEEVL